MKFSQAAYGFRFDGIAVDGALAAAGAADWPLARVRTGPVSDRSEPLGVRADSALLAMPEGAIAVDRSERSALIETPRPLEPEEVVHPYLWPIATVLARWAGRETFHAGAIVVDGDAWAVLGDRGQGKSSLLAWLALRAGLEVLTDDLLVAHGQHVYAGPRCLDLRPAAAAHMEIDGRPVRCTRRRRLSLPPIAGRVPLRGWIFLDWGPDVAVDRLGPSELLPRLRAFRRAPEMGVDGVEWLGLVGLPAVVLRRPRRWALMDEAAGRLLDVIGAPRSEDGAEAALVGRGGFEPPTDGL